MGPLVRRAGWVTLGAFLVQVTLLAGLSAVAPTSLLSANGTLLLFAVTTLGGAWALRKKLKRSASSPCLSAGLVSVVAIAAFLAPRLASASAPALATLAVVALTASPLERAWSRFVLPSDERNLAERAALASSAPLAGLGLAAGAWLHPAPWAPWVGVVTLAAAALGAWVYFRGRRALDEAHTFADHLQRVEVRPDTVLRPPSPRMRQPFLRSLDAQLRARAERLAREAEADTVAREQIGEARLLRTRFMAAMSHELRSPLNSIVGFAQLLEGGIDGDLTGEQRESVRMVRRSAEELILLLTDVLDLARLEAGRLELRRQWTPSVEILTEAVSRGRAIVQGREVQIEAEMQPGLPPVFVDQGRIVQAVVALFRNAASSLSRTTIRLRARIAYGPPGPRRHLRVEIHDALGAIPEEDVERIFEAFQEISEPSGRRVGGLGMALSLSRGLVRLHGGDAWAETSPTADTVLCVALPLDAREPADERRRA